MRVERVLWVEDQKEFVESLYPIVERVCSQIYHVDNLQNALTACNGSNFDLILLDLQLEQSSWAGLEFLKLLGPRVSSVPIVILSGAGTLAECIEAIRLGAKDYVQKENARKDLIPVVLKVVQEFRDHLTLDDYARLRELEIKIKNLVLKILKEASESNGNKDIFKFFVPQNVAIKSYERWLQSEEGKQEEFLDLLDFATIIDKQWNKHKAFQDLQKVINPRNREERTQWLVDLNEARKLVAHPIRGNIGDENRKTIQRAEEIVAQWIKIYSQEKSLS